MCRKNQIFLTIQIISLGMEGSFFFCKFSGINHAPITPPPPFLLCSHSFYYEVFLQIPSKHVAKPRNSQTARVLTAIYNAKCTLWISCSYHCIVETSYVTTDFCTPTCMYCYVFKGGFGQRLFSHEIFLIYSDCDRERKIGIVFLLS